MIAKKEGKFYGILLGLLDINQTGWSSPNAESGIGYSIIIILLGSDNERIVIEIKYAGDGESLGLQHVKNIKTGEEKIMWQKLKRGWYEKFCKYGYLF